MQAFDRLARGDVSAETLGMLFNLRDRDFWKGAVAGSAVALANLPALKAMFAVFAAQGFGMGGMGGLVTYVLTREAAQRKLMAGLPSSGCGCRAGSRRRRNASAMPNPRCDRSSRSNPEGQVAGCVLIVP